MILALLGCGAGPETVVLDDDENYVYTLTIAAGTQRIAAGEDATVDWGGLGTDLLGAPIDPAVDVDTVGVIHFRPDQPTTTDGIACGTLHQSDVEAYASKATDGATAARLSELSLQGTAVDPAADLVEDPDGSYLVSVSSTATDGHVDYRGFAFFAPTAGDDGDTVAIDDTTATSTLDVDLVSPTRVPFPVGTTDVTVDWAGLEAGSCGELDLEDVDRLALYTFDAPPEELEDDFPHVADRATHTWVATEGVAGYGDLPLSYLPAAEDGTAFTGIDAEATWLLVLSCSTCLSPAPPFVGVLTPE